MPRKIRKIVEGSLQFDIVFRISNELSLIYLLMRFVTEHFLNFFLSFPNRYNYELQCISK